MALKGVTPPGAFGGPSDFNAWVMSEVAAGNALGWTDQFLENTVANMFPGWSTTQVAEAIELGREQLAAGQAFGGPGAYERPGLANIPLYPGYAANTVEVSQRVTIVDDDTGDVIVDGFVSCDYTGIPTEAELQQCADAWAEQMIAQHYPGAGTWEAQGEVTSARRGGFFGG